MYLHLALSFNIAHVQCIYLFMYISPQDRDWLSLTLSAVLYVIGLQYRVW